MANFDWRLAGRDTLAYLLDEAEVVELFDPAFSLADDETVAVFCGSELVEAIAPLTPGLTPVATASRKALERGKTLKAVFLRTGPVEVVRHLALADAKGGPVRSALKLRLEVVPERALDFAALSGGGCVVTPKAVESALGAAVEAALAARVAEFDAEALAADAAALESLRGEVVACVRTFAAGAGFRIAGLGLAWGFDAERVERMAAAGVRQEEAAAAVAVELENGLARRAERLTALNAAVEAAKIARETELFAKSDEFLSFASPEELADSVEVSFDLPPASESAPVSGELSTPELQYSFEEESGAEAVADVALPAPADEPAAASEESVEGEPDISLEPVGELSEPAPEGNVAGVTVESLMVEAEEVEPVKVCDLVSGEEVCAPRLTLAERLKTAPGLKPYGDDTVACFVEEPEIPRLFRKDFALAEDEAVLLIRNGKCEDFATFGTERTSGAMGWISRLFTSGREVTVLFARLGPFHISVDIEGMDGAGDQVFGVVTLSASYKPLAGVGLLNLFEDRRALSVFDLADSLRSALRFSSSTLFLGVGTREQGFAELEGPLAAEVRRELSKAGLQTGDIAFDWAGDEESFARIDVGYRKRAEAEWCFSVGRGAMDTRRRIELASRKVESLSALAQLPPTAKPEVGNMLARAGFGPAAAKGAPKKGTAIEEELRKVKIDIAALTDELAMLVETGDAEYRHGQPPVEERRLEGFSSEEEGFLGDSLSGEPWDEEFAYGSTNGGGSPLSLAGVGDGSPPVRVSGGDGMLRLGGGTKLGSVSNRCPHCMAPIRKDSKACGNCGRRL